jgi:SAM-dependent methyltransferase
MPDNNAMPTSVNTADWNSFGRANASQKWRRQSAVMGNDMTQAIVAAARVKPGMRVLDIACGTGEPAISLAALLAGEGEVVGVDISPAPLKIAEERAAQRGLSNATFQQAYAHALPFPDNSFDCITSRLGIMFFSDLPRALNEMRRVLKPEGRAILLVWGPMDQPYFLTTIGTILRMLPGAIVPESGREQRRPITSSAPSWLFAGERRTSNRAMDMVGHARGGLGIFSGGDGAVCLFAAIHSGGASRGNRRSSAESHWPIL